MKGQEDKTILINFWFYRIMFARAFARSIVRTGTRCINTAAPLARGPAEPHFNRDQEIGTEGK